ncbi:TadE/TadG family type IV pilus assembly protein [Bosea sp. PAMC 26642]|uniref:TadE/TadG family type IV pilus assembly protein n=1 Tax=Bosea sp. (strain PAMC 26642) TaxID=1792307 RepID=UPI0007703684|nr:pilus assembly protein TadG-related protein [Bosea sp. PAMC 26642]AMJ58943.1 hypothetical protein AXW83_00290 [Bosea sp. PAMC 26642]
MLNTVLNPLRALIADQRGVSSVMLAVSLPVIVLSVGGGIDMTRAIALRQQVASAIELACKQSAIEVDYKASKSATPDKDNYKPFVDQLIQARLTSASLTGVAASSVVDTKKISITASTVSPNVFAKVLNFDTVPISLTRECARSSTPPPVQGTVLFSESFEVNHNVASNDWTVLKNWNGWTTKDAGIEINGMPQLSGNTIRFGNFFAELDSDCLGASNCQANSTMSRELTLAPGKYELRYWYISRVRNPAANYVGKVICGTDADVAWATWEGQTNRIEVFFEKQGSYNFAAKDMVDVCVHTDQWTERKIPIVVTSNAKYRISWRAAGRQDTYGGLIDYLRFCSNTCP